MALIGLGAKMAKADGVVTRNEERAFLQVFRAPPGFEESLRRAFDLAKQTTLGFDATPADWGGASRIIRLCSKTFWMVCSTSPRPMAA